MSEWSRDGRKQRDFFAQSDIIIIDSTYIILITDFPLYLQQHLLLPHEIAFVLQGVLAKVRQLFSFCRSRCRTERRQT